MSKRFIFTILSLLLLSSTSMFAAKKTVTTSITSNPSGATFIITGTNYNSFSYTTPQQLNLRPGSTYTLQFSKPGYKSVTFTHVAGSGSINVTLQPDQPVEQKATVKITSNPSGANVMIQGPGISTTNLATPNSIQLVLNNTYNLTFSKPGYKSQTISHTVNGSSVHVTLAPDTFNLTVNSNIKGAYVYLDKQHVGNSPVKLQLGSGTYQVEVKQVGYKPFSTYVTLKGDQNVYANLVPDKYLMIKLPKNAKLWVNGRAYKIKWGKRDTWKDVKIDAGNGQKGANIKIQYYRLTAEKYINFNRQTISLQMLITGGGDDDDDDYDDD